MVSMKCQSFTEGSETVLNGMGERYEFACVVIFRIRYLFLPCIVAVSYCNKISIITFIYIRSKVSHFCACFKNTKWWLTSNLHHLEVSFVCVFFIVVPKLN